MKDELLDFEIYLIGILETESSVEEHLLNVERFDKWCSSKQLEKAFLTRNNILEYTKFMQKDDLKVGTQNNYLNSLDKYYEFLKLEKVINKNPVRGFRVRNAGKKVVYNPLSEQDLLELFNSFDAYLDKKPILSNFPNRAHTDLKAKLIVSLVVFQGLHTGELDKLTVHDVNPLKGTMYVPSTSRSNSRVLSLHQRQPVLFYEYLNSLPTHQEKLFDITIQTGFYDRLQELKGLNPDIINLRHLRASVLINWIKIYGKRKAQYMIGHRFVSSTEKYEIQDTTELSELMEATHLFG